MAKKKRKYVRKKKYVKYGPLKKVGKSPITDLFI